MLLNSLHLNNSYLVLRISNTLTFEYIPYIIWEISEGEVYPIPSHHSNWQIYALIKSYFQLTLFKKIQGMNELEDVHLDKKMIDNE